MAFPNPKRHQYFFTIVSFPEHFPPISTLNRVCLLLQIVRVVTLDTGSSVLQQVRDSTE